MAHKARKRFGQNFLHDPHVIDKIVRAVSPKKDQHLVEIGPGQGAITAHLLDSGAKLDAIELDRDLVTLLAKKYAHINRFQLHSADALKFDFCELKQTDAKLRIVGNLPYNISTPLLFHLLDDAHCLYDMHFMLQKEVVERMAAAPGSKTYGRLSVMLQAYCKVQMLFPIGSGAFQPAPKVDSAFVRLVPYQELPIAINNPAVFSKVVAQAFSQRRKTLRNTLKELVSPESMLDCNIAPSTRAEQLSVADFCCLSNAIS